LKVYLLAIFMLFSAFASAADDWTCPNPKDDFCDAYHAEYLATLADKKMNVVYQKLLNEFKGKAERQPTIKAQRAWLKYADAHCAAVLSKFRGATFTMAEMEHSCRTEQINERIKELESYCEFCSTPALTHTSIGTGESVLR